MSDLPLARERIEEIVAGCEGVTPGPYFTTGAPWFRSEDGVLAGSPDGNIGYLIADCDDGMNPRDEYTEGGGPFPLGDKDADAAHFARLDPATVRALCALALKGLDAEESEPYCWVYDSPGHFDPQNGGEPPYTDFSDEPKPGYRPLFAAPQPAQVAVKPLEWEDADEGMCTKWRAAALGGHYELVDFGKDDPGFAVNFHWGRPFSFWFIQGEPDEWGPTGPKIFPTLQEAKAAAQADYETRIRSALAPSPADGAVEAPNPPVADPSALTPLQVKLLESGARYKWIWLSDDAAWHTSEVVALGELRRAGLVEFDPGPFPPGPPAPAPSRITEAGRKALSTLKGDTP